MKTTLMPGMGSAIILSLMLACGQPAPGESERKGLGTEYDFSSVESGDIIVKCGKGMISNTIVKTLKEPFALSHCGIIVREEEAISVIHSVAREVSGTDGVQRMSLTDFLDDVKEGSLYIVRLRGYDEAGGHIAAKAAEYLDARIPFDYDFDLKTDGKIYCTELVYKILIDLPGRRGDFFMKKKSGDNDLLLFGTFLNDEYFAKVNIRKR